MTLSKRAVRWLTWSGLISLALAFVLAAPLLAAAVPNTEPFAYYSVVRDKPYAAFTTGEELQRTSPIAYYSVVRDKPFAPFTAADQFKRTSTIAYYSVVH